ncbi:hypothetical protein DFH27DRAFT_610622 [Peziza echinospora]|nr:hypothetical protein DFH27DRAFT_610622 [Peziza echinospora]
MLPTSQSGNNGNSNHTHQHPPHHHKHNHNHPPRPALYKLPPEHKQLICSALYSPSLAILLHLSAHPYPPPHLRFSLPSHGEHNLLNADLMLARAEEREREKIRCLPEALLGSHYLAIVRAHKEGLRGKAAAAAAAAAAGHRSFKSLLSDILYCRWGGQGSTSTGGRGGGGGGVSRQYPGPPQIAAAAGASHSRPEITLPLTAAPHSGPFITESSNPDTLIPLKTHDTLCDVHFPLCPKLLRAIMRLIEKEIGPNLDTIVEIPSYRGSARAGARHGRPNNNSDNSNDNNGIVDIIGKDRALDTLYVQLKAIYAYWLSPAEYTAVFGPPQPGPECLQIVHVENNCDGCIIISAIVSLDSNLVNLRAAAQLRVMFTNRDRLASSNTDPKVKLKPRTRPAELVTWIEHWMTEAVRAKGGGLAHSIDKLIAESDALVEKVLFLRRKEKIARYLDVCPSPGFPDDLEEGFYRSSAHTHTPRKVEGKGKGKEKEHTKTSNREEVYHHIDKEASMSPARRRHRTPPRAEPSRLTRDRPGPSTQSRSKSSHVHHQPPKTAYHNPSGSATPPPPPPPHHTKPPTPTKQSYLIATPDHPSASSSSSSSSRSFPSPTPYHHHNYQNHHSHQPQPTGSTTSTNDELFKYLYTTVSSPHHNDPTGLVHPAFQYKPTGNTSPSSVASNSSSPLISPEKIQALRKRIREKEKELNFAKEGKHSNAHSHAHGKSSSGKKPKHKSPRSAAFSPPSPVRLHELERYDPTPIPETKPLRISKIRDIVTSPTIPSVRGASNTPAPTTTTTLIRSPTRKYKSRGRKGSIGISEILPRDSGYTMSGALNPEPDPHPHPTSRSDSNSTFNFNPNSTVRESFEYEYDKDGHGHGIPTNGSTSTLNFKVPSPPPPPVPPKSNSPLPLKSRLPIEKHRGRGSGSGRAGAVALGPAPIRPIVGVAPGMGSRSPNMRRTLDGRESERARDRERITEFGRRVNSLSPRGGAGGVGAGVRKREG